MSDKLSEFVGKLARLLVPEDNVEATQDRREQVAHEIGRSVDEDVIVNADDEFLCSETQALWKLIREARELLKTSDAERRMEKASHDSGIGR